MWTSETNEENQALLFFLPTTKCCFLTYFHTQHAFNSHQLWNIAVPITTSFPYCFLFYLLGIQSNYSAYCLNFSTNHKQKQCGIRPHFTIVYRPGGYAHYHFTGGSNIIVSASHFTIIYQTAVYLIQTQQCYCISPMGKKVPTSSQAVCGSDFTSGIHYVPCSIVVTHPFWCHTHTHHLGFLRHCLGQSLCSLLLPSGTESFL
jgi:hypothetical protein